MKFYKDCIGANPEKIRQNAIGVTEKYEKKEVKYVNGGEFLPLSVWAARGGTHSASRTTPHPRTFNTVPKVGFVIASGLSA